MDLEDVLKKLLDLPEPLDDGEEGRTSRFSIFTDPNVMHRYYDVGVREIYKAFSSNINYFNLGFSGYLDPDPRGNASGSSQVPDNNLRDEYLKPGYDHQQNNDSKKADSDVDGRVNTNDLETIFSNSNLQSIPREEQQNFHVFGQSIISSIIRNADGSFEMNRTIIDRDDNKETTTTQSFEVTESRKKEIMKYLTGVNEWFLSKRRDGKCHPNW